MGNSPTQNESRGLPRRTFLAGSGLALLAAMQRAGAQTKAVETARPGKTSLPDAAAGKLAVPMPANPSLGVGKDRALVLGGGGEYFISWMLGYGHGLSTKGVNFDLAEVIVGTSAGSVLGSTIAGGHLKRVTREFDFFGRFPKILAAIVPVPKPNASQLRARALCKAATNGEIETIQSIGRGAMAAKNPDIGKLQMIIEALTGNAFWPSPKFHATAMDCYTGERLVVSQASGLPISHAVSSSMSLPGIFGPTWLGDRLGMDGGMGLTSTHCDLVSGARRALVISLTDGMGSGGARLSNIPNMLQQEIKDLEASGTKTLLIAANPGAVNLMSPAEVAVALKEGHQRGLQDAERVSAFWA